MHEHVGALGEPQEGPSTRFILEIEHDAALVAVAAEKERGHARVASGAELPGGVALRRFDFDDVGAEVAELLRRIRAEHDRSAIQNFHAG